MIDTKTVLVALASACGLYVVVSTLFGKKVKLPPGPKGYPIIGNMLEMPTERAWNQFTAWGKQYGDVMMTRVLGQKIVVLNSRAAVDGILQKKSGISSDRPPFPVAGDWGGFGWALFTLSYTEEFKLQRRMMTQVLGPKTHRDFDFLTRSYILRFCQAIASKGSDNFVMDIKYLVGSTMTRVIYGHKALDLNDEYIQGSERLLHAVGELGPLGQHPVDLLPRLAVLPPGFFGSTFKKAVLGLKHYATAVVEVPYAETKNAIQTGVALKPSMVQTLSERNTNSQGEIDHEHSIKAIAGMTYTAGVDAVISAVETFILFMASNPRVQAKARKVVDEITGGIRMPEWEDRDKLPYIEAVVMEILRLGCNVPLALPHRLAQDDVYNGITIPAGTVIVPNSKGISREEKEYPNPNEIVPERYLEADDVTFRTDVPDPRVPTFGYGRRVCPGRHIAESMLWKVVVTMLTCFEISKPLDANGKPVEYDMDYDSTLIVSHPRPFKANIVPRSAAVIELLNATAKAEQLNE